MAFAFWPAVAAGLIGGIIMVTMGRLMKAAGIDLQISIIRMWGTVFKLRGTAAQVVGWVIHLLMSALIALIYALGFEYIFHATDQLWFWGLLGGLIHWFFAGLFMMAVPVMHPEIPEERSAPGAFAISNGIDDAAAFLVAHLVYGVTVGIVYAYLHTGGELGAAFLMRPTRDDCLNGN